MERRGFTSDEYAGDHTLDKANASTAEPFEPTNGKASKPTFGVSNGCKMEDGSIVPFSMSAVLRNIRQAASGWPRRVGDALFVDENKGGLSWIESSAALFGYFGAVSGLVHWHKATGCHTKEEVFQECRRTAQSYLAVETMPHEPPIVGHYYACQTPEPGDGNALRELVARFKPSTLIDRDLIEAAFATIVWGGAGGARPGIVITSDAGRGTGKSKLAATLGYFAGGVVELSTNESSELVKQRLLSPEGITKRVALLDNVKTYRFSSAELEAMVTAPVISGKRLYVGEASRPNTLTWVITLNGVSLGTDMAQRSVIIKLDKPEHSGTWEEETFRFIELNRDAVLADLIGFLRRKRAALIKHSRWSAWERDILSRLPDPSEAQKVILERQGAADVEEEESDIIEEYFRGQLDRLGYDTAKDWIRLPSQVATRWFNWATNENHKVAAVGRILSQGSSEGRLKQIRREPGRAFGRCFLWVGRDADPEGHTLGDIDQRLKDRGDDRRF